MPRAFRDELNTREDARETGSDLRSLRRTFAGRFTAAQALQDNGIRPRVGRSTLQRALSASGVTSGTSMRGLSEGWSVVGVIPG